MKHLIITAHPRIKSFNHAVVAASVQALEEMGHKVVQRDLYAMGFDPNLSARDMTGMARGMLPRDIRAELKAIQAADVVTFVSPLWWRGFPAIMKGYVDRVFTAGTGYLSNKENTKPSLSGRKAVLITTSEASIDELKSDATLRTLKRDRKEIMNYCGIELVGQLFLGGISPGMGRRDGDRHLEAVRRFVRRNLKQL